MHARRIKHLLLKAEASMQYEFDSKHKGVFLTETWVIGCTYPIWTPVPMTGHVNIPLTYVLCFKRKPQLWYYLQWNTAPAETVHCNDNSHYSSVYIATTEMSVCLPTKDKSMYNASHELQYLEMVIEESLRMYPPAPGWVCIRTWIGAKWWSGYAGLHCI